MKIASVIGARPQFIKAAPIELALSKVLGLSHYSIHTGQHYDRNMSDVFFDQLGLVQPYVNLGLGGGSHASQTAGILAALEPILLDIKPDALIVYGDTNSTLAASLCAAKIQIPVVHIEAGLRSFNREMPEEINRILTDHLSALLFAPTQTAIANLEHEGIFNAILSGDVMLDMITLANEKNLVSANESENYIYATIHRPYNTDKKERLSRILNVFNSLSRKVVFSIHPRTAKMMREEFGFRDEAYGNIQFIPPQGYFENLGWMHGSTAVVTDSGGMQKEAYFLQKKCITLRSETEWVETLEHGCNTLVWENPEDIEGILNTETGAFINGLYGDGHAADAIVGHVLELVNNRK